MPDVRRGGFPSRTATTANLRELNRKSARSLTLQLLLGIYGSDWQSLLAMETTLASVRKQLGAIQGQLQSLNRDLNPDEKLVADNQDKKDWQDARRWLRDSLATVSRWIRDHDIGMVSAAGNRNRFEQVYREHVVPNVPYLGIAALAHDFEQHRKTAQNLLIQMQSAHQNASRDGVNRVRQVLSRISRRITRIIKTNPIGGHTLASRRRCNRPS